MNRISQARLKCRLIIATHQSSSSTGSKQTKLLVLFDKPVGSGRQKTDAGGAKRMADRQTAAPGVDFLVWDLTDLRGIGFVFV